MAKIEAGRNGKTGLIGCLFQRRADHLAFHKLQPLFIADPCIFKERLCHDGEGPATVLAQISLSSFLRMTVADDLMRFTVYAFFDLYKSIDLGHGIRLL